MPANLTDPVASEAVILTLESGAHLTAGTRRHTTEHARVGQSNGSHRDLIIACLLDPERVRERVEAWRDLVDSSTGRVATTDGVELLLPNASAPAVAELVRAEHQCCPFFGFVMRLDGRGLALEVTAPPEARLLIDELLGVDQTRADARSLDTERIGAPDPATPLDAATRATSGRTIG